MKVSKWPNTLTKLIQLLYLNCKINIELQMPLILPGSTCHWDPSGHNSHRNASCHHFCFDRDSNCNSRRCYYTSWHWGICIDSIVFMGKIIFFWLRKRLLLPTHQNLNRRQWRTSTPPLCAKTNQVITLLQIMKMDLVISAWARMTMIICLPIMMKRTFYAQGEINFSTESKGLDGWNKICDINS